MVISYRQVKSKLLVAVVLAIHISTVFAQTVQTYKDAYGSVWYMTAINPPEWGEGVVGVNGYYPVKDNGSAYVYKIELLSSATELRVPTALTWSSGGSGADAHPSIEYLTREATANHPYLTTVSVNRSTELRAPYFRNCGALKEFTYEGFSSRDTGILQNSKYAVQGGVLYDGQLADLKKYPEGKDGDVFTVPASVVSLHQFTFANTKLKKIVFEGNAPKITRAYSGDTWQTVSNTVVSGSRNLSAIGYRQGASGWGRYWCGIPAYAIPNAVTGLSASQGTSSRGVVLTWDADAVASQYDVYRAETTNGARTYVGSAWYESYVDRTVLPRREYCYWVVPRNHEIEGAVSGVVAGYADDPKFHFKEDGDEAELVSCECAGGPLEVPQFSESGLPVTRIGEYVFRGSGLDTVSLPEGVTSIGAWAFESCHALKRVTLPSTLKALEEGAFYYCDALEIMDLNPDIENVGDAAFQYCSSLTSITIPESVTNIGADAFKFCESLTSVTIPENLTNIGGGVFSGCSGLADANGFVIVGGVLYDYEGESTEITIPQGVTGISGDAFEGISYFLTSVTMPESVTNIGAYAFRGCSSLASVEIPESVTGIGDGAFWGCSSLTSVTLPENVLKIGDGAFSGCRGLANANGFVIVRGVLYGYEGESTEIMVPKGVTVVSGNAFGFCQSLTSVTLPQSVTSIGKGAFSWCSALASVSIPRSVKDIQEAAFSWCEKLSTVVVDFGDSNRIREMLEASGFDASSVGFVEKDEEPDSENPTIAGDDNATVTGDAEAGFVVRPSAGTADVVVEIPNGVDAAKVQVVLSPDVKTVTPNGAAVRVVRGEADITDFLDIPAAVGGVIDLGAATVKPEFANEPLDPSKDAKVNLSVPDAPSLTTAPTRRGLVYQLKEGATLEAMEADADGDATVGDGQPWTPKVTVKGGASGFYSIRVSK